MRPTWVRRLLPAVFALALAVPLHGQSFGFPWWNDAQFQRDLSLSTEQSARIEAIFRTGISTLRHRKVELDLQEAELSRLIAADADESVVTLQVDKVEAIRSDMNKTRTLMLLHERQVLTPDQRAGLNKLHEQREKDRRRPGRGNVR